MLEASKKQILKAFLLNSKAGGALQGAHPKGKGMLLFYGVECGLKHIVMDMRGYKTTRQVADEFGHNLRKLMSEARISPSEINREDGGKFKYPVIRRMNSSNDIGLSEFHVAMRYSVELEPEDERTAVAFLENLTAALKLRLVN